MGRHGGTMGRGVGVGVGGQDRKVGPRLGRGSYR